MAIIRFENESDLIEKLKGKDEKAFAVFVNTLQKRFYSIAYGILGRREDAEDAVESAFLEAYRNIDKFQKNSSLYSWLYRILVNKCYHITRQPGFKYEERAEDVKIEDQPQPNSPSGDPAPGLDNAFLRSELSKLPKEYCETIILRVFEDMSYKEIAQTLGINEGTVMSRLYRARAILQKKLKRP